MIEQDNNGMKTPWTELELGNSCYSSYIVGSANLSSPN